MFSSSKEHCIVAFSYSASLKFNQLSWGQWARTGHNRVDARDYLGKFLVRLGSRQVVFKNKTFCFHVYPEYSSLKFNDTRPTFSETQMLMKFLFEQGTPYRIILSQCLFEKWGGVSWCVIYNNLSWSLELLVIMNPWPILGASGLPRQQWWLRWRGQCGDPGL